MILLANLEEKKDEDVVLRSKCVRSNRYTVWKLADNVEKLNVNKTLFCVKKRKILNIFLISSMKILEILKYFIIN